jgi:hypothetical protein
MPLVGAILLFLFFSKLKEKIHLVRMYWCQRTLHVPSNHQFKHFWEYSEIPWNISGFSNTIKSLQRKAVFCKFFYYYYYNFFLWQMFFTNWFVEIFLQLTYKNDTCSFKHVRNTFFFINAIKKTCKKHMLFK